MFINIYYYRVTIKYLISCNIDTIIILIIYTFFICLIIMNNNKKSLKYVLTALVILTFSTFLPTIAYAAPLANNGNDWQNINGNSWAQNYSPQTQINKNNVGNLEIKWLFPLGSKALASAAIQAIGVSDGAGGPPVVRNGVVYVKTTYGRIYAIDAKTGKQQWGTDYTINITEVRKRLPLLSSSIGFGHHGFRYWESGDVILDQGIACD